MCRSTTTPLSILQHNHPAFYFFIFAHFSCFPAAAFTDKCGYAYPSSVPHKAWTGAQALLFGWQSHALLLVILASQNSTGLTSLRQECARPGSSTALCTQRNAKVAQRSGGCQGCSALTSNKN